MDYIWPAASTASAAEFYIVTGAAIELLNHLPSSAYAVDKRKHPGQKLTNGDFLMVDKHNIAPTQSPNETIDQKH